MDVIAANIANMETTRTPNGEPYRRQRVSFSPLLQEQTLSVATSGFSRWQSEPTSAGVRVAAIDEDPSPFRVVYDPSHPDADADGNVAYPNVEPITEMTDMLSATRAYEANVTVLNATKGMAMKALEIGKV
jgi:flagellar basal-body rod protein FlgC